MTAVAAPMQRDGRGRPALVRNPAPALGEGPNSQAVGVQLELIAPAQHVPAFDNCQCGNELSRVTERRGDRGSRYHLRKINPGSLSVVKLQVDREVGVRLGVSNAMHVV